jgi:DNA-directed RNA polymerase I, II, and III subunit RPABC1
MDRDINTILLNLKEMLITRGDNISLFIDKEKNTFMKDFLYSDIEKCTFYTDNTCIIFALNTEIKKNLITDIKIKPDSIKLDNIDNIPNLLYVKYKDFIDNHNNKMNYIFIFNNITSCDKKIINLFEKTLQSLKGNLSTFLNKELYMNPTKHVLVDEHIKLNQIEINELMLLYNIKFKTSLPLIVKKDPIAKWLGLKNGDIVMINRYNPSSGYYKYYRACT